MITLWWKNQHRKNSSFPGAAFELMASLSDLAYCPPDYCCRHGYSWTCTSLTMACRLDLAGSQPCDHAEQPHGSWFTWSLSPGLLNPMRPWLVRTESQGHPKRPAHVAAAGQCCDLAATQDDPQTQSVSGDMYSLLCKMQLAVSGGILSLNFTWLNARWICWCLFSLWDHCKNGNCTDFKKVFLKESFWYLQPRHAIIFS